MEVERGVIESNVERVRRVERMLCRNMFRVEREVECEEVMR